jgi:hypothetical protein
MLLTPFLFSIILLVGILLKINGTTGFKLVDYFVWLFLFLFFAGVYVFLFINHFSLARNTEVFITYRDFEIVQNGKKIQGSFNDIQHIMEYNARRLPWMSIIKWEITVGSQKIILSSLTISKSSFDRYFYNKIDEQFAFFPRIKQGSLPDPV